MSSKIKKIHINLTQEQHTALKVSAAENHSSIQVIVEGLIDKFLNTENIITPEKWAGK